MNIHYDVTGLLTVKCGGHTQVRSSGESELAREEGGSVLIRSLPVADN